MNSSDPDDRSSLLIGRSKVRDTQRLLFGITLVLALVFAVGESAQAKKAKHELKIATLAPDGSTWMKVMHELDDEVRAATDNQVGFRFYPGGIQGDEGVVLRKIRTGQIHGAGLTGVGLGEIAPSLRVMELPFLFADHDEVAAVHAKMDPKFEADLGEAGFALLGWAEVGFVYLYSKEPIKNAGDLKAKKIWLWEGDPLAESFLESAGVSPVPLSVTDVMTSLQTGLINSVYVSPLACIALQWFTRVGYTTDLPFTHAIGAVVVSNKSWGKIPEEQQKIVRGLCDKYFTKLWHATREENQRSREVIAESGVKTVAPDPGAEDAFRIIGAQTSEDLVGKLYDRAVLDEVQAELEAFRAAREGQSDNSP